MRLASCTMQLPGYEASKLYDAVTCEKSGYEAS